MGSALGFGTWIKERVVIMCSALVSVYRLMNEYR